MRYSRIEGETVVNVDSITLPVNLVFHPNENSGITSLNVYNISQFKRNPQTGAVFFDGDPTNIKIGDTVTVVKSQNNVNGKNYWFTEGGLMIPKEGRLFKLTDSAQNVSDTPPNTTPTVFDESAKASAPISIGQYLAIEWGYPALAGGILGITAYKLAISKKKPAFLLGLAGLAAGIAAGTYASKFHFKKIGFEKTGDPLKQLVNP